MLDLPPRLPLRKRRLRCRDARAALERHPEAAAITGQPTLPAGTRLPFAEKLNVVANLMDVLPVAATDELMPVGFAEGRCDVFRVEALRARGPLRLTPAGLRRGPGARGAPAREGATRSTRRHGSSTGCRSRVNRTASAKLLRHQRLFGRTTPYILLAVPGSLDGLVGPQAGANRTRRALAAGHAARRRHSPQCSRCSRIWRRGRCGRGAARSASRSVAKLALAGASPACRAIRDERVAGLRGASACARPLVHDRNLRRSRRCSPARGRGRSVERQSSSCAPGKRPTRSLTK